MNITTLDPIEMVPKYFRIANAIRHKIEDQEWEPYTPIPSERQLEKLYNVSRTTIRQGIEVLIHQGYLYREHGRGTFIAPQKLQKHLSELTSFSEDMIKRGLTPGQIILNLACCSTAPKHPQDPDTSDRRDRSHSVGKNSPRQRSTHWIPGIFPGASSRENIHQR